MAPNEAKLHIYLRALEDIIVHLAQAVISTQSMEAETTCANGRGGHDITLHEVR